MTFERFVTGSVKKTDTSSVETEVSSLRDEQLSLLRTQRTFDLVVVGGGLLAAIVSRAAAFNSFKVVLVAPDDFIGTPYSRWAGLCAGPSLLHWWTRRKFLQLWQNRTTSAPHLAGLTAVRMLDSVLSSTVDLPWLNAPRFVTEQVLAARHEGCVTLNYVRPVSTHTASSGRIAVNLTDKIAHNNFEVFAGVVADCSEGEPEKCNGAHLFVCRQYVVPTTYVGCSAIVRLGANAIGILDTSDPSLAALAMAELLVVNPVGDAEILPRRVINRFASRGVVVGEPISGEARCSFLPQYAEPTLPAGLWGLRGEISSPTNDVYAHTFPERAALDLLRTVCEGANVSRRLVPLGKRPLPGAFFPSRIAVPGTTNDGDSNLSPAMQRARARFGGKIAQWDLNHPTLVTAEAEKYARREEQAITDDDVARRLSYCIPT